MSAYPSLCAIPVRTATNTGQLQNAVSALNTLFQTGAEAFTDGIDTYQIKAHPSEAEAVAYANSLLGQDQPNQFKAGLNTQEQDSGLWLTVIAPDNPGKRTDFAIDAALHDPSIQNFLRRVDYLPEVTELDAAMMGGNGLRTVMLDAVMFTPVMDALYDLPANPYDERIPLSDRGGYVKLVNNVDPVAAIFDQDDEFAVQSALVEWNADYLAEQDDYAAKEAAKTWRDQDERTPAIEALGFTLDEAKEGLEGIVRDRLAFTGGVTNLVPDGNFALTLAPKLGKENVYIEFDGITSSRFNAVVDENYFAMLDHLKIDVKSWVRHLAEGADLGTPQWDVDLKGILSHKDPESPRKDRLIESIFFRSDDHSVTDSSWANAEYLMDIALEVLKPQAAALDEQWMLEHGVDLEVLATMTSSKQQHEAFPQLRDFPSFETQLSNMGSRGCVDYEWSTPPNVTQPSPLASVNDLCSVLDNCSYSGTLTFAFEADYSDLQKIHKAAQAGNGDQLSIKQGYFHIHSYSNGAGDGEALTGELRINAADIGTKWEISNDANSGYGICETFGQFLASSSSVSIINPEQEAAKEAAKRAQAEQNAPTLG